MMVFKIWTKASDSFFEVKGADCEKLDWQADLWCFKGWNGGELTIVVKHVTAVAELAQK